MSLPSIFKRFAKLSSDNATVGSSSKPVYVNAGETTACSATVGSSTSPVYMNGGTITVSTSSVGSATKPIYLNSGTLTASGSTVGSSTSPVYLNSGTITECGTIATATTATKLGSSTVGGTSKPIYLNSGTATAISDTVGGTAKPIYSNAGTLTAISATVGSGTVPIYSNSGTLTASTSTVGSGTKPVYLNSGTITASSSTVGSATQPVYFSSGTATACNSMCDLSSSQTVGGTKTFSGATTFSSTITTSSTYTSSQVTSSWVKGTQGYSLINSSASAGSYVSFLCGHSTNGYFTLSTYQDKTYLVYITQSNSDSSTNTTTYSAQLLTEAGATTFPGAVKGASFQATSDIRKKDIIKEADIDLSSLKAYRFNWKDRVRDPRERVGLIAQEVEQVLPEAIDADDEGTLHLDYNAITAVLVNEVNKLKKKISELEAQIKTLSEGGGVD